MSRFEIAFKVELLDYKVPWWWEFGSKVYQADWLNDW